jgi:hypothetical protein
VFHTDFEFFDIYGLSVKRFIRGCFWQKENKGRKNLSFFFSGLPYGFCFS